MSAPLLLSLLIACSTDPPATPDRPARAAARRAERPTGKVFRPLVELDTRAPGRGRPERGGEAVAIFDVDGDGPLDVVIVAGENRIHAFHNEPKPSPGRRFTPRETPVGPGGDGHVYEPKGLGLHDLDGDGALDLWVGNQGPGEPVRYKADQRDPSAGPRRSAGLSTRRNAGDGTFPPLEVGLVGAGGQRSLVFADFDGDGLVDAFRGNSAYWGPYYDGGTEPSALQRGVPGGRFGEDVLPGAVDGAPPDFWTDALGRSEKNLKAAVARDLDRDGRPDLVLGAFADVWANWKADVITGGEGWQGTWARGVFLLQNTSEPGRVGFREVAREAIGPGAWNHADAPPVHAVVPADLDGDADLDLVLTGYKGLNGHGTLEHDTPLVRVLRNDSEPGRLRFVDVTAEVGLDGFNHDDTLPPPYPVRLTHFGRPDVLYPAMLEGAALDVDNDGDVDLVMAERQVVRQRSQDDEPLGLHAWLFLNEGGRFRVLDSRESGLNGTSRALSYGDLDADGRLDVVVVDGSGGGQYVTDSNRVYLNAGDDDRGWLDVEVSLPGDAFGIGTRVTVRDEASGRVLAYDEARTDFCYRSRREPAVHAGTGEAAGVRVELVLPDGRAVTCAGVAPRQRVRVVVSEAGEASTRLRPPGTPRSAEVTGGACSLAGPPLAGRELSAPSPLPSAPR